MNTTVFPTLFAAANLSGCLGARLGNVRNGLEGIVKNVVLDSWDKLDQYRAPDANIQLDRGPVDWDEIGRATARAKNNGELTGGGLAHGFHFPSDPLFERLHQRND
jgi:hypothetical protein